MSEKRMATYQDVLDAPEHMVAELIDGELFLSPRPKTGHTRVATLLGHELLGPFDKGIGGPGGWYFLDEPELHFGARIVVPDLAGWRTTRMPVVPDEAPFLTVPPDWVCEIASKSTEKFDRKKKLPLYASEEVGHVWLIDPRIRALQILRRLGGRWLELGYYSDADKVCAEPFEAIELDLSLLWRGLPYRASEPQDSWELPYGP
jgi:Uma2 family endonuclease